MAKSAKDDTPGTEHNSGNLKELIQQCAREIEGIRDERAELNERARDIRTRVDDAGISKPAFDYACRLYRMEQEARDSYMDSLKLCFDSLGIGGQGDMFPEDQAA